MFKEGSRHAAAVPAVVYIHHEIPHEIDIRQKLELFCGDIHTKASYRGMWL